MSRPMRAARPAHKMAIRLVSLTLAAGLLALVAACGKPAPRTTIQEFMEGEINPAGDFVFKSVQHISDGSGVHVKAPKDEAGWKAVRDQLMVLHDAPKVLTADGLLAAKPGFKSEHPGIESEPAEIQAAVDKDRLDFNRRAFRLQSAASVAIKAVDSKDRDGLYRALDGIDKACESCHLKYFYPRDNRAKQAAKEDGITY